MESGTLSFRNQDEASDKSELATDLLKSPSISGVLIGRDFVTVTKAATGDWDAVHAHASGTIRKFLEEDRLVVSPSLAPASAGAVPEVELKIRDFLEREIRPAVARDGGDIVFDRYEEGRVYLYLQGSCSGCPSAAQTLKLGVEARLKQMIPEIQEVVSVA